MPHNVNANLVLAGVARPLAITFEDSEWVDLEAYSTYARQLLSARLVQDGGSGSLSMSFQAGAGWSYKVSLPPDDDICALLHRVRPFLLKDEPTNFYKIAALLSRRVVDEDFHSLLKRVRRHYSGRHFQDLMVITSNETVLNSEDTLFKWLNAHEYHRDKDKQRELEALHQIMPLESSRAIFLMMIYDQVRAICVLAGIIETIIGRQERFECTVA